MRGQSTDDTITGLQFSCEFDVSFSALDSKVNPQSIPGCHCHLRLTEHYDSQAATFEHVCPCLEGFSSHFDPTAYNVTMVDYSLRTLNW